VLSAKGIPKIAKGFKGSTNKKIANIIRREVKPIHKQLTTLQQAQLQATELIANMLGGYAIQEADALYIADNPDLQLAQKVWKWGLGGFGYSSTGVNGPYTTAITADGSIVAMLVAANIVTANMIQTGVLQSQDGSTWINLDDGSFNFKNVLTWINGVLSVNGVLQEGKPYNGVTISDENGIRVQNDDGSYTTIDGRGINRVLSIPIYEDSPSETDVIENFETGVLSSTKVNMATSAVYEQGTSSGKTKEQAIQLTTAQAYAGSYGLKVEAPIPINSGSDWRQETEYNVEPPEEWYDMAYRNYDYYSYRFHGYTTCYFWDYTPTKNCTFSMKYKIANVPYSASYLRVTDLTASTEIDYDLTATSWSTITHSLVDGHVYRFFIRSRLLKEEGTEWGLGKVTLHMRFADSGVWGSEVEQDNMDEVWEAQRPDYSPIVYVDDIVFEEDVIGKVIVGYEEGEKTYDPFFHVGTVAPFTGAGFTATLPEYFRGLNYRIFVFDAGNADHIAQVASTDNTVPSITFQGGSSGTYGNNYIVVV
jgi:hypothetical protein